VTVASSTGAETLTLTLAGTDANNGAALSVTRNAAWTIANRASLAAIFQSLPATATQGRPRSATVRISNTGGVNAAIGALGVSGSHGTALSSSGQFPTIAAASFADIAVVLGATTTAGPETLTVTASGTDAYGSVTATPGTANWTVQTPAALRLSVSPSSSTVSTGQTNAFVAAQLQNSGQAAVTITSVTITGSLGTTFASFSPLT